MAEVKSYKVLSLPSNPTPDSIYWVKGSSASDVIGYITDRNGVPYPLKDLQGSGGITGLTNTDGNLVITGADNKVINLAPALLSLVNSALQSGANISELVNDEGFITVADIPTNVSEFTNDAGYLTSFIETDPIFQASEASLFVAGDKANLDNQSGINSGDETTLSIQTKRPLKTINGESLEGTGNVIITIPTITNTSDLTNDGSNGTSTYVETDELGAVAFSNDYNDLDNKPTIPTGITNHSGLSLDDGTNPHGTTKGDVGLGNVDNTSDANKPISNATQDALNLKLDKVSTSGVERAYIINADGSQGTKATSEWVNANLDNYLVNITTPSPNHTGTSVETNITSYNFVIPANTLSNGDTLRIENMLWEKIGILNTSNCRLKLSNTNNFATANQVAIFFNSSANIYMRACRTFNINGGLLRGVSFTANAIFNDFTLTNLGFSTLALNFTQPIYGFISLQLTNPADIVLMRELKIRKI